MPHTRKTLQLDPGTWDLTLDGVGNIGVSTGVEATAQDVANEARLFLADAYFNQDQGNPYFVNSLGQAPGKPAPNVLLRAFLRDAALKVDDVKEVLTIDAPDFNQEERKLTGAIQFSTIGGENGTVDI